MDLKKSMKSVASIVSLRSAKNDISPRVDSVPLDQTTQLPVERPPDGGYGWVCTAAVFMLNFFSFGATVSYGVYLSHYLAANLYPSATPLDYALIGDLNIAMAALVGPLATTLCRLLGRRPVMLAGCLIQATGFITAAFTRREIWQLYLSQGVAVGLGMGLVVIPAFAVLPQWFSTRRSIAAGVSSAGTGLGGVVFSFITASMIDRLGIHNTLWITGMIGLGGNFAATMLVRDCNTVVKPAQRGFALKLLARYDVLLLLGWGFVSLFGYMVLLFSPSDFAISVGLSSGQATLINALLNVGMAVGRPFVGVASDRWGRIEVAGLLTFVCGLSCFLLWIPATTVASAGIFFIIGGATVGTWWATIAPLTAEVVGLKESPSVLSLAWLSIVVPSAFAEVIALYLKRPGKSYSYLGPQLFAGFAYVLGSMFLLELRRVKRKEMRRSLTPA